MDAVWVLVHSPLVGPATWTPVAEELRRHGIEVIVPVLADAGDSESPFWLRHVHAVEHALQGVPRERPLVLVGHSGAGPLLPIVPYHTGRPVAGYLFVDAGLPHGGQSRLDEMAEDVPELAAELQSHLRDGGRFPTWGDRDLLPILPDPAQRAAVLAELQPHALPFFTEPLPTTPNWPDAPGAYLQWSAPYDPAARRARALGWPYRRVEAGHFHLLVDPTGVAAALIELLPLRSGAPT